MACTSFDAMVTATESLSKDIHRSASHTSVWLNAMPRATYLNGTGLTQTTFTVERSEPVTDDEAWTAISLSTGASDNQGACATAWTDVDLGYTKQQYSPLTYALRGPVICSTDLAFEHNAPAFLSGYVQELGKRAKRSWENKMVNEYMRVAQKGTLSGTAGALELDATIPTYDKGIEDVVLPTGLADNDTLTQDHLDKAAIELIEGGATEGDSNGWITLDTDGPVFPLLVGVETSNKLASSTTVLRDNLRYGEPNQLLKRIGAARVLGNMRHVPQVMMPRFNFDATANSNAGGYVRVNQYEMADAGTNQGKKAQITTAWKTAKFEAAIILNPSVYTVEAIKPVTAAAGLSWSPQDYNGNWQFVVGGKEICGADDPLKKLGRHYAEYQAAFRPVRPLDGITILHRINA